MSYNNILYLATVLAELDSLEDSNTKHKILLIEEPEAHLHPQLQIKLLQYLQEQSEKNNIQIIVTTHSSTITASCNLECLNVLTIKDNENPIATSIADCNLDSNNLFFLERWLDITKSTLFFAKGILFVEGIAEALVIKELSKKVISKYYKDENSPKTLDDFGISVVNLNGIYFRHFMQLFQGYRIEKKKYIKIPAIPIRCAGITDCDPQKVDKTKPTKSSPCECGNTHSFEYANELMEQNSIYCRIFTNLKTFEYDLGMEENNLKVFYEVLYENYIFQTDKAKEFKTKSETNWAQKYAKTKANECFNLLSEISSQKGEFAQKLTFKLANNPEINFVVPEYIEDAILWVTNTEKINE